MLSRFFGEETFLKVQKSLVKAVGGKQISTAEFIGLIERITDQDLQPFANQFIYNTGLTEVFYDWRTHQLEGGNWEVQGVAHQVAKYRYNHRLVRREDGGIDVDRLARRELDVAKSVLIVPVEIDVYDPQTADKDGEKTKRRGAKSENPPAANKRLAATTWVSGVETPFRWELPLEPRKVQFDRKAEVFGVFLNQRRFPKRTLYLRAIDRFADADGAAALDLLDQAREAEVFVGSLSSGKLDEAALSSRARRIDIGIDLVRARCLLMLDQDREAGQAVKRAEGLLHSDDGRWYRRRIAVLKARIALRAKDPQTAYDLLRKVLRKRNSGDTEGQLLYAAAAKLIGHSKEFEEAKAKALSRGADVTVLKDL